MRGSSGASARVSSRQGAAPWLRRIARRRVARRRATAAAARWRALALVLVTILVVAACSGAAPVPTNDPAGAVATDAAATGAVPDTTPQAGASGDAPIGPATVVAPLTQDEVAAWEDALIARVVRASGILDAIGADGWAAVDEQMRDIVAKALADHGVAGTSRRIASTATIADPDPVTAAGGAVVGLAVGPAMVMVGSNLRNPETRGPNLDVDSTSTAERTVNGQREVITTNLRIASSLQGSRISATFGIAVDVTTYDAATGEQTGTLSYHSTGTMDIEFCPDAEGKVRGHVSGSFGGNTRSAGGADVTVDAEVIGIVGEDAYLQSVEAQGTTSESSTTPSGSTRSSSVSGGLAGSVGRTGDYGEADVTEHGQVDTESGDPLTDAELTDRYETIGTAIRMAVQMLAGEAQAQWRGGACVEIQATERSRDVRINELVQFEAKVFHKIEQVELSKPIVPTFAGEASLDPVDISVPSPVLLSYKAASQKDRTGTVTLTTTSNRGIGTLDITFRTRVGGWMVDFASGTGTIQGQHCGDPPGEWVMKGTYDVAGMKGKQTWVFSIGATGTDGTYTYQQTSKGRPGGSPVTVSVRGTARGTVRLTIDPDDGTALMEMQETSHEYQAKAGQGWGASQPLPLERSSQIWEVDPSC